MLLPIDVLSSFFDDEIINVLKKNNYSEIWDYQWECIQKCLVENKNLYIGLPTGSGKTFPAILSIINTVLNKKGKAIYIVPLRALAKQKFEEFNKIFIPLGISVGISTGDYAKSEYTKIGKKDVIVATIEKVDSLIRHNEEWLYDVTLFVIDEIQMVDDPSRGFTLEIVVSEIIRKFKNSQRIALSAVIGNPEDFKNWLADDFVFNEKRIIPLYKDVLTYFGKLPKAKNLIPIRENLCNFRPPSNDQKKTHRYSNTIDLVKYFIDQDKQCIVFTNGRKHAEKLANCLALDVENGEYRIDKSISDILANKIEESIDENTNFSRKLIQCIRFGVSFHHAGLHLIQRNIIENAFSVGELKVLIATPTLEQGVNLPANVVIISDLVRWSNHLRIYDPLPVNSVLNMMGRAGRPYYHNFGEAVLIEDRSTDGVLAGRYINKSPERVLSQLRIARTRRKHLNGLIASNKIISIEKIFEFLETTLWFTIFEYEFEGFELENEIMSDLSYLENNGFIKKSGSYYVPTNFGKAVSDSCIDCETGLQFLQGSQKIIMNLEKEENLVPWPIFQLLLLSTEINAYRPYDNEGCGLEIASRFEGKGLIFSEIPDGNSDEEIKNYSQRSLLADLFCDWIDEKPLEEITNKYDELGDADFYEIGDILEWLGDALVKIAALKGVPKGITDKILIYCDRVVGGVKEELLEYLRIEGVRRKSARNLFNAGYSYFELKDLDHQTLSKLVGPFVSGKIRLHFEKIAEEGEETVFDEEQIYDEVREIITIEENASENVEKLVENDKCISSNLKEQELKERCKKIKEYCESQLTWMHSDSKYFRFFTNHGIPHSDNVFNIVNQLLNDWELKGEKRLNQYEYFLLTVCCWCHDLGMLNQEGEDYEDISIVEEARKQHARRIVPFLDRNFSIMGLSEIEKAIISQICLHHSSKENIEDVNDTQTILINYKPVVIRAKLLSAILRLSDALDIDNTRLPRKENRNHELISDFTKREYKKHEIVHKVAINSKEKFIFIQVLLKKDNEDEYTICEEVKEKLIEEFNSVNDILSDYGINFNIKFLKVET